jgi:hypothetical protein
MLKAPGLNSLHWLLVIDSGPDDMGTEVEYYETEYQASEAAITALAQGPGIQVFVARVTRQGKS